MRPLKNNLLVVDAGEENKTTAAGIILKTDLDKGSSKPGIVMAVGPDVKHVKVRDKIALQWEKGLPIMIQGEKALLIEEDYIKAVY